MSGENETARLLAESAEKLFAGLLPAGSPFPGRETLASGTMPAGFWPALIDSGLGLVMVPEAAGGLGGGWQEAYPILHAAGYHALPLPIAEQIVAWPVLAEAGQAVGKMLVAMADRHPGLGLAALWADEAEVLLDISGDTARIIASGEFSCAAGAPTLAGEPLFAVSAAGSGVAAGPAAAIRQRMALARVIMMAGAMNRALELALAHANERQQFGKPIGKFQAIQHSLALLANEAAAVNCAATGAARAADGADAGFEIPAAKLKANRAVDMVVPMAHQVHGAIGFTEEYPLQRVTRRLLAWRGDYGNDRFWAQALGAQAAKLGGAGLWPFLTARSDGL